MSSYDFKVKLNPAYDDAIINKAREIRQNMLDRFENNQVNWSARRMLNAVEQSCPSTVDVAAAGNNLSVAQANRDAMMQLKNTLNSIRSHRESQFNESVPPSTQESRIRATVAVDQAASSSSSSSSSTGAKPTAVTVNARPLNMAAFTQIRDTMCQQADIPIKSEGGEVHVVGDLRIRLKANVAQEDIDAILKVFSTLQYDPLADEDNGGKQRIETDSNGNKILVLTHIFKQDDADPFQKLLGKVARSMLDLYRSDPLVEQAADSAPGVYRLATARLELPQNIGDWLNSNESSWFKLVENSRLAFEGIIRHDVQNIVHQRMASMLLGSFDSREAFEMLQLPIGAMLARDTSVNLKMPPLELLYAMMIKEGAFVDRRAKEVAEPPSAYRNGNEDGPQNYAALFDKSTIEDFLSYMASEILFLGITSTKLRERAVCELSRPLCEDVEDENELPSIMIGHLFPLLSKCVAEVVSASMAAHSFQITANFEGIDGNIWKFLPTSAQGMLDEAKAVAMACFDHFTADKTNTEILDEMKDESNTLADCGSSFKIREYWPRGGFSDRAEEIVEKKLAPGQYKDSDKMHLIMSDPKRRTASFRVAVCVNSEDKEFGWARVIKAFGGEVFNPNADKNKNKNRGSDEDSDAGGSEDEDENPLELPAPDEGFMRVNYLKRPDGRYVELIRPNSTQPGDFAFALIGSCDAIVVVDSVADIEFLKDTEEVFDDLLAAVKAPILFLSTKGSTEQSPEADALLKKLTNVKKIDNQALPESESAAAASADSFMYWLTSNSENPNNGTASAEPATAFDFAFEQNICIP